MLQHFQPKFKIKQLIYKDLPVLLINTMVKLLKWYFANLYCVFDIHLI